MIEAVLFDMDGTLVDSEPVWVESWKAAFEGRGLEYSDEFRDACIGSCESRISEIIRDMYRADVQTALAAQSDHVELGKAWILEKGVPLKPGASELLGYLCEHDIPCAVASSSWRDVIESNLRHADVSQYFSCIASGDMGLPSKPAPDIFFAAAEGLGVEPGRTLVLEDSPTGIRAASAGGFVPVLVPDLVAPGDEVLDMCAFVCDSLFDVLDLFRQGRL